MTDSISLNLLRTRRLRWRIAGSPLNGPTPISGPPQRGRIDGGGWWVAELDGVPLNRAAQLRVWRALMVTWDTFAESVIVPVYDQPIIPRPGEWVAGLPLAPHSDDTPFSDGTYYDSPTIDAQLVGGIARRATSCQIQVTTGGPLLGGEYFTLVGETGFPRLHLIGRLTDEGEGLYTVQFGPPTREAYDDATPVDFDRPRLVMDFDDANEDAWPWIEPPFKGRPSPRFLERVRRPLP